MIEINETEFSLLNMVRGVTIPLCREVKTMEGQDPHNVLESLEQKGLVRRELDNEQLKLYRWKSQ